MDFFFFGLILRFRKHQEFTGFVSFPFTRWVNGSGRMKTDSPDMLISAESRGQTTCGQESQVKTILDRPLENASVYSARLLFLQAEIEVCLFGVLTNCPWNWVVIYFIISCRFVVTIKFIKLLTVESWKCKRWCYNFKPEQGHSDDSTA